MSKIAVMSIVQKLGVSYVEIMDAWTIDEVLDALDYLGIVSDIDELASREAGRKR